MIFLMKRRTMVTYKPDFRKAYKLANEILLKSQELKGFPFSVTKVIREITDIQCCSYDRAHKYDIDIEAFGSDAAILTEYAGRLIIFYNQQDIQPRIRFSMLHEIGHYLLEHKLKTENLNLYEKQEVETNYFAAQLLMPEQTLIEIQARGKHISTDFLVSSFQVSKEAARKRIETLNKVKPEYRTRDEKEFDDLILLKYKMFLDSIIPAKNSYNWFDDEYERQRERDSWY